MPYSKSQLDTRLLNWFENDNTCATLHRIQLKGRLRGLNNIHVDFSYPITAFAGKNGCGKTTMLALAACAYHSKKKGSSKRSYYTFSDFFIQTAEEIKPEGIEVWYKFLLDNWKGGKKGFGFQLMQKRQGGKWSKYEKRVKKNVIYLGIERVVPQTEKKVYKSYIKIFRDNIDSGWYDEVHKNVGKILGKNYSEFKIKSARNYNLQFVKESGNTYSGFNMGAGEKALFELFALIHKAAASKESLLIIIDEIELGLHEIAQRRLIEVLKQMVKNHRLQIICTTHSPAILDSLPLEGRFYIDKVGSSTIITKGISGEYAAGRLSDSNSNELDIYVEDVIGATILRSTFDLEMRERVGIIPVGSFAAVCRQLGAAYRHPRLKNKSITVLDGDQSSNRAHIERLIESELEISTSVEKLKLKEWLADKIFFIPGNENPEKWLIREAIQYVNQDFSMRLGATSSFITSQFKLALSQDIHYEIRFLTSQLKISEDSMLLDLTKLVAIGKQPNLMKLKEEIQDKIEQIE